MKKKKNWGLWQVFNFFSRQFFSNLCLLYLKSEDKKKQLSNDNFNRQLQFYNSIYLPAPHCNNTLAFFYRNSSIVIQLFPEKCSKRLCLCVLALIRGPYYLITYSVIHTKMILFSYIETGKKIIHVK